MSDRMLRSCMMGDYAIRFDETGGEGLNLIFGQTCSLDAVESGGDGLGDEDVGDSAELEQRGVLANHDGGVEVRDDAEQRGRAAVSKASDGCLDVEADQVCRFAQPGEGWLVHLDVPWVRGLYQSLRMSLLIS